MNKIHIDPAFPWHVLAEPVTKWPNGIPVPPSQGCELPPFRLIVQLLIQDGRMTDYPDHAFGYHSGMLIRNNEGIKWKFADANSIPFGQPDLGLFEVVAWRYTEQFSF